MPIDKQANDGWYNEFLADMHNRKVPNPKDPSGTIAVSSLRNRRYQPEGKKIFDELYKRWKAGQIKGKDMEVHPDHANDEVPTITSMREKDKAEREAEREKRRIERVNQLKEKLESKKDQTGSPEEKRAAPKPEGWSPASAIKRKELQSKIDSKRKELSAAPSSAPAETEAPKQEESKKPAEAPAPVPKAPTTPPAAAEKPAPKAPTPAETPKAPAEPDVKSKIDEMVRQKQGEKERQRRRDVEMETARKHIQEHIEKGNLTPEDAAELKKQLGIVDKKPAPKQEPKKLEPHEIMSQRADAISRNKHQTAIRNIKTNEKSLRGNVSALPDPPESDAIDDEVKQRSSAVSDVFSKSGISSELKDVTMGPNFTTYHMSITPEDFKKVTRTKGIEDLISLKSRAPDSKIELNKTKGTLDVQIPNSKRHIVHWKQLVTDPAFLDKVKKSPNSLNAVVGQDNDGNTRSIDLSKDPHIGIVGGTGSGKTVTMNGLLSSIISTKKPEDVQLSIIDVGKQGAGFKQYNGVSNMSQPVIDNEQDAHKFFQGLRASIDTRNQLIKKVGGDIDDFNNFIRKDPASMNEQEKKILETIPEDQRKPIPRHVVAVDEFGDLMRRYDHGKDRQDFIKNVVQTAQVGRSAGVNMILATQHPNNSSMPLDVWRQLGTRLVHKVNDESASHYIGVDDAHRLSKHGDMVMATDGGEDRVQAGYISSERPDATSGETSDLEKFLSGVRGKNPADPKRFQAPPTPPDENETALRNDLSRWESNRPQARGV